MTAAANQQPQGGEDDLGAARAVAETVGALMSAQAADELAHLRWTVCRAEAPEVFAESDARGVPMRLLVRAFALVAGEPIGGSFLVDGDGVHLLNAEQLIALIVGDTEHRWVGLPTPCIAAMPRNVLRGLHAEAPNVARAVEAILQTAA